MRPQEMLFVFHAAPPPREASTLAITSVGHFRVQPPYECRRPDGWHAEHLLYTLRGAAVGEIAGKRSKAVPGSLWITPKDRPYEFETDPDVGHWEGCWIEFDGAWVRPLWSMLGLGGVTHIPDCNGVEAVVGEIFAAYKSRGDEAAHEAAALLWRLFAVAERALAGGERRADPGRQAIARAQRFARENLAQPIVLADMARAARLSPYHFARVFREKTGFTPAAYLRTLRLSRAQDLLRRGELNVSEVGRAVGFPIRQHFSAAFKHVVGMCPRNFVRSLPGR